MTTKPDIQGAIAMARGLAELAVDTKTNQKLARVSRDGKPLFVIQIDTDTLHIWVATSATLPATSVARKVRSFGYHRDGNPAALGQPGKHSGLKPFFGTHELTCFNPKSLDEAWELVKSI